MSRVTQLTGTCLSRMLTIRAEVTNGLTSPLMCFVGSHKVYYGGKFHINIPTWLLLKNPNPIKHWSLHFCGVKIDWD